MTTACGQCGEPMQRTIARPQYGTNPAASWPRGVGQRPWVHSNYLKQYDHQAGIYSPVDETGTRASHSGESEPT